MIKPAFLLDSNICIYVLEGLSQEARRRIEARVPGEVVTSTIVYAEVMRGIAEGDEAAAKKASGLFSLVEALPFDQLAAKTYASLPFRRGSFDRLIAAHALSLGLTLVTNNENDFADVAGLRVENWAAA